MDVSNHFGEWRGSTRSLKPIITHFIKEYNSKVGLNSE